MFQKARQLGDVRCNPSRLILVGPTWRLSPFPFAGRPVVAGDAALDHFVAPLIACHDEGSEVAAAEAKRAKCNHDDELQQHD
jgi:hypothetical protein